MVKPKIGEVFIKGRIAHKSFSNGTHYIQVMMPAIDEYSRPQCVEVRHTAPLGGVGDVIEFFGQLGGYQRSYQTKGNPAQGIFPEKVTACDMTMDFVR
jgi:hypothetical protein